MIVRRWRSFRHALAGASTLVATQPNARIHAGVSVLVIAAGIAVGVPREEWLWLVVAIALVWSAEAFNTAIVLLGDAVAGAKSQSLVGKAKDVAAAGVLLAAMGAAAIGVMILVPRMLD